jgi:branched-subunit amino acid aminotransferase/4-amino-4-deoxychorismate lyase
VLESIGLIFLPGTSRDRLLLTDVHRAGGAATAGTLGGIRRVASVDHRTFEAESPLLKRLADAYDASIRGGDLRELAELES